MSIFGSRGRGTWDETQCGLEGCSSSVAVRDVCSGLVCFVYRKCVFYVVRALVLYVQIDMYRYPVLYSSIFRGLTVI